MLANLTGLDSETYLNVVQAAINAQEASFPSFRTIQGPPRETDIYASPSCSVRHSAYLIALRQEIWSVLLYRRPFRLPLGPDNDYTQLEPADDFVWTNRIILWCADVLRFCFGGANVTPGHDDTYATGVERWDLLKTFEQSWDSLQPPCFKPLYYEEPNPTGGKYFPKICHMNDCQVLGLQHVELARMLLAVYNPRRQRLGLGASALNHALESQLQRSTLRLCGLALFNKKCQATMVTAAVGVSMCGEYFYDAGEQTAIVDFMKILEDEHAWPTQTVVSALRDAWNLRRISYSAYVPRDPSST